MGRSLGEKYVCHKKCARRRCDLTAALLHSGRRAGNAWLRATGHDGGQVCRRWRPSWRWRRRRHIRSWRRFRRLRRWRRGDLSRTLSWCLSGLPRGLSQQCLHRLRWLWRLLRSVFRSVLALPLLLPLRLWLRLQLWLSAAGGLCASAAGLSGSAGSTATRADLVLLRGPQRLLPLCPIVQSRMASRAGAARGRTSRELIEQRTERSGRRRWKLALSPFVFLQPRHDFDEVARAVPVIELEFQD